MDSEKKKYVMDLTKNLNISYFQAVIEKDKINYDDNNCGNVMWYVLENFISEKEYLKMKPYQFCVDTNLFEKVHKAQNIKKLSELPNCFNRHRENIEELIKLQLLEKNKFR